MGRPTTIDEYLEGFIGQSRERPERLRALAGETAPTAREAIKWGYPAARQSFHTTSPSQTTCCAG